jgi:ArsR family transcriptional regulator, arsenate/arsenite/antimonite-responsive transcriptional repressor
MAHSKKNEFNEADILIARFAKALGHPARIAIMKQLASLNNCCFGELFSNLPIAQSTVSQHLSELKDAGLIQGSIEPPRIKYCINRKNWTEAQKLICGFLEMKINNKIC